jgi:hypothetical protein
MDKPDQTKDLIVKLKDLIEQFRDGDIDEEDDEGIKSILGEVDDYLGTK